MHILFLTDNFPPEVNAPASRTFEHCREWVKAGHQVTVITGAPNFPKGKVFDGYQNRLWQQEDMAGIRVIRVWTYITANEGFAKRTLDYLSYMVTGFLASLFERRVDVVVGTSPQFFKALKAAPDGDRFRFVLLGDGANKTALRQRAQAEGLDNVIFVDSVPKDQVVRYWSLLDVSIIHLKKDELFTTVIPSKLFECMGMAIPVLHGVEGESADIVKREDVGLTFEPQNNYELINALRQLADDKALHERLKANGPTAARRYDRTELAVKMLGVLESVARR